MSIDDIFDVSDLRHYLNIVGRTGTNLLLIANHFNTEVSVIQRIDANLRGAISVRELIESPSLLDETISTKKQSEAVRQQRIEGLLKAREVFCGMGTRKAKIRLNKIGKNDAVAFAYRLALEAEDLSIQAKNTHKDYAYRKYESKENVLSDLVGHCLKNGFRVGKSKSDVIGVSHILYFDLPFCEQLSYHTNLPIGLAAIIDDYQGVWDGKENSVLQKIESAIKAKYPEMLE